MRSRQPAPACAAWRLGLALLVLAPSAAARTPQPAAITADAVRRHITLLASEALQGRLAGTRGNERAARYIADAFRHAGLQPIGTSRQGDPRARLDGTGYFQPFTFTAGVARGRGNRLEATVGGHRRRYRPEVEFDPAGASASGSVSGGIVFAGYGIQSRDPARDDYGGLEAKGQIVLVLAGHPGGDPHSPLAALAGIRSKAMTARDRGAAALLVILPQTDTPHITSDGAATDAGLPIFLLRRSVAEEWLRESGHSLADVETALAAGPQPFPTGVRADLSADVRKVTRVTANILGLLPGDDPALRAEVVVVGAHMDHLGMGGPYSLATDRRPAIHPGADDNASGTAGVLLLARALSAEPRPRRSVLFVCFSGEELGLLGSAHYVRNPIVPTERTAAMLNMDMVGRMNGSRLIVGGSGTSPAWDALLERANRGIGLDLAKSESGFGGSDHQSFYTAHVPVLFFFTGVHADYHRPTDTADRINAEGEVRVLDLAAACVRAVGDLPERPAFRQVAAAGDSAPTRFRVSLGTVPDYAAEVEGVLLSGVRPGSPAEKAGLRAGDILVRLGDRSIRSIQEYATALTQYRPGDVVQVVVRRGGDTLTFTATLAASTGAR